MLKKWVSSLQLARDVWRRKLGLLLFDKNNNKFELHTPLKRVVLVRWDAKWGDAIVSSFVFDEWRKAYPNIKIDVITTPNMSELFKAYFGVDSVYEIKKRPSYGDLNKLANEIGEADLLVHLSKALKMKDFYFLSKVKSGAIAGLDDEAKIINLKLGELTKNKHFSDKYKALLEATGVSNPVVSYVIPDNEASRVDVNNYIDSLKGKNLVFNPYGSGGSRQLTKNKIIELIDAINSVVNKVNIILLFTPDKKIEVESISNHYDNVFFYPDSQSIYDSIAIMRCADWIVSVDTATVHVASGLNKPLLALYNTDANNYEEWHPNNEAANSIFSIESDLPDINLIKLADFKVQVSNLLSR